MKNMLKFVHVYMSLKKYLYTYYGQVDEFINIVVVVKNIKNINMKFQNKNRRNNKTISKTKNNIHYKNSDR